MTQKEFFDIMERMRAAADRAERAVEAGRKVALLPTEGRKLEAVLDTAIEGGRTTIGDVARLARYFAECLAAAGVDGAKEYIEAVWQLEGLDNKTYLPDQYFDDYIDTVEEEQRERLINIREAIYAVKDGLKETLAIEFAMAMRFFADNFEADEIEQVA